MLTLFYPQPCNTSLGYVIFILVSIQNLRQNGKLTKWYIDLKAWRHLKLLHLMNVKLVLKMLEVFGQGNLTEEEGSVQMTS